VLVAFSIAPSGGMSSDSVSEAVAAAVKVIRASGLPNRTDAMFTTIEGETWDEVMAVVKAATEAVHARSPRTGVVLKLDWRDGVSGALDAKVATVERHLAG